MFISVSVPNFESLRWHSRVLLIFAAAEQDKNLREQEQIATAHAAGFSERDMKVLTIVGEGAEERRLRQKLHLSDSGFVVVLIGKDGSVKLKKNEALSAKELFATIDAMPMRQAEMKRSK